MKIGDLVEVYHHVPRHDEGNIGVGLINKGIIVDIDPLRRHQMSKQGQPGYEMIEIVVMLPCGTMWHAAPKDWSVIVEGESPDVRPCKQTPAVV